MASLLRALEARAGDEVLLAEGRPLALRVRVKGASPLHAEFAADPARWRDEIEAAAQRAQEDIAIERLLLETEAPVTAKRLDQEFDFAGLLDACLAEPGLREAALAALANVEAKIPAPGLDLGAELDALLREARDLAVARAEGGAGS